MVNCPTMTTALSLLTKWKKAVVHIEGAADSKDPYERDREWIALCDQLERGEISREEWRRRSDSPTRDRRYQGTAIYLRHLGGRFLVTARHVLWDEFRATAELKEAKRQAGEETNVNAPQSWIDSNNELAVQSAAQSIFKIIFRVPTLDEVNKGDPLKPSFLMSLGSGAHSMRPYTFSTEHLDLAVLSLNHRSQSGSFADELESVARARDHRGFRGRAIRRGCRGRGGGLPWRGLRARDARK